MRPFLPVTARITYTIQPCSSSHFEAVKKHVAELELDDRQLQQHEFLTASSAATGLAGFGRVRQYKGFSEMCSLGILPGQRGLGLAKELCRRLIEKANGPIYLVCIMPAFFEEFGFLTCHSYPAEIQEKLLYCTSSLAVPEPYVVMKKS